MAIEADPSCQPDNPFVIAAAVKGTNNVSMKTFSRTRLGRGAITKGADRDGDGDPDEIHFVLEVNELNGASPDLKPGEPSVTYPIAPGIEPGIWTFSPKTRGMSTENFVSERAQRLLRLPPPVLRVEQGDRVRVTLANTHYFPHTIHFHGVDHPYQADSGQGNDGVPGFSEVPVMPGKRRTYTFTPRESGTFFYHCHVQPDTHILMGLAGMIVVEENRPDNRVQSLNIGAGRVRHRSQASQAAFDREYDLQYQEMDRELHQRIRQSIRPRRIARSINREYKPNERDPDYYLLNGRSFPYTLRESLLVVAPEERIKLRVLNVGNGTLSLHTHGHKPEITHLDGMKRAKAQLRDTVTLSAAQRADLALSTPNDGRHSYGPGVWFMHDHREPGVTTNGMSPGGDITAIVYEAFLKDNGLPQIPGPLTPYFTEAFYQGRLPVWGHLEDGKFLQEATN